MTQNPPWLRGGPGRLLDQVLHSKAAKTEYLLKSGFLYTAAIVEAIAVNGQIFRASKPWGPKCFHSLNPYSRAKRREKRNTRRKGLSYFETGLASRIPAFQGPDLFLPLADAVVDNATSCSVELSVIDKVGVMCRRLKN